MATPTYFSAAKAAFIAKANNDSAAGDTDAWAFKAACVNQERDLWCVHVFDEDGRLLGPM